MTAHIFDDHNIRWQKLGDFEHFTYYLFDVDIARKTVDFIVKFDPNQSIFLHRHRALTHTFVLQGEHRLYEPDGGLKEARPAGSYTASPAGEPHREGGGAEGAVVVYSIRGEAGVLFEVLDDDFNIVGTLGLEDFGQLLAQQNSL
ncbi:cupin domain-containing protein [Methylomagnum ishizawai]|uniref:cupin domain-containing protein n=1 Tax=Methylomagnum ishizawai TaxID=1760988 RepID=UPI001C31FC3F|nr:regulator [Methylomagnum ishizawai]BBL73722.1 hypothetical protein MishRS11D_08200 [Methylomagnum ishizawai]